MDEPQVTFTVSQLLDKLEKVLTGQMREITSKLDDVARKLDEKASNVRVEAVEKRLAAVEERIGHLELNQAGARAVSAYQRFFFGTIGVGVLGAIATLVWLASGGH